MKKEHELVLKAALIDKSEEEVNEVNAMLEENLDWIEIAGLLLNHRLGGYFYMGLSKTKRKKIPKEIRKALELLVKAQKQQIETNSVELEKINDVLVKNNIRFAALKGAFFGCEMYEKGTRRSNDLDLLVYEEDLDKLDVCLRNMGYIQSNRPNGELIEATKKEKIIQRMNYHDLVPYVKASDDGIFELDINFLFDGKANLIDKDVYDIGTQCYKGDYKIMGLNYYTNMAFLCVHFFREASDTIWTSGRRDVTLYKIVDMMNYIKHYREQLDCNELVNVIKKLHIEKKAYFTFKIMTEFYSDVFLDTMLEMLHEYETKDDEMKKIYDSKNKTIIYREETFYEKAFARV